jgi:hypothetical protein
MLAWTDRGVGESLCIGTPSTWWEQAWTAQAIEGGALASADGVLNLRIADSFVSIAINSQVRERVEPAVHRLDRRCAL